MAQITCPHCKNTISLDGADYDHIANQVRNAEFEKSVKNVEERLIAQSRVESQQMLQNLRDEKDAEISRLKDDLSKTNSASIISLNEAKNEITLVMEKLEAEKAKRQELIDAAVKTAISQKEAEIVKLESQLENEKTQSSVNLVESVKKKDE